VESHRTERVSSMAVIIAVVMAVVCLAILGLDHSKKPIPAPRRSIGEPHEADDIAPENAASEHNRGRQAESPAQISLRGWKDVIVRVWRRVGRDNLALVAAGVAFYAMLAVFPALAAFVSTYALVADAHTVRQTAIELSAFLPPEAAKLLIDALSGLVDKATSKLSLGLILGVLIALWSARAGMSALMTGLNIADEEEEKRGFIDQQIVALFLTIGALIVAGVAVVALAVIPVVFTLFPIGDSARLALGLARWPILTILMMLGLAVLYRFAPSRREPKWKWVSWGAVFATAFWLFASAAFSYYVSKFGAYDAMYGSLGAVIVLLLWFWLSALIVLVGAMLNAEAEHQTLRDTTIGQPKPLGARGAHMADTVGVSAR
jgi:membrane protein